MSPEITGVVNQMPTSTELVSTTAVGQEQATSYDVMLFGDSMARAELQQQDSSIESVKAMVKPLDYINSEANDLFTYAKEAVASGNELAPSEMVMLTARSHEFMFHCQLVANVANRTSDGMQQLFRQQN